MTGPATSAIGTDDRVDHPLDNVVWHALRTAHRDLAEGDGVALRYRPEVAAFHAVDRLDPSGWAALAALAGPGRGLVLFRGDIGPPPECWSTIADVDGHQMVATRTVTLADAPSADIDIRPLGDDELEQILDLVALTQPGPFAPRTIELGGYVGVFDGRRLVAMAGERMRFTGFAEVSAVCTHPDARGRGLAAALTRHVATGIEARGETPFLHVAATNTNAQRVYARLGFERRRTVHFVVVRTPEADTSP
jgi:ribosomal protein S18 acetylase RimI-like enzyme